LARHGLNCTFSFSGGSFRHSYRVRAGELSYGVQMVATESVARIDRAYYPHRTANQQFSVQVLLKNWGEREHFVQWLVTYAAWALDPDSTHKSYPYMTVTCPRMDFFQRGLPIAGYEWGAHTGMMMFTPVVVFEAAFSPGQNSPAVPVSEVINKQKVFNSDPAIRYFYPFGVQLSGDQVPSKSSQVGQPPATPPSATGSSGLILPSVGEF
jgi:hypothetical protein